MSLEYRQIKADNLAPRNIAEMLDTIRRVIWVQAGKARFFSKLLVVLPHLDTGRNLFPDAHFVYIICDARQTANSMVKHCRLELEHQRRIGLTHHDSEGRKQFFVPYPRFPRRPEYVAEYGLFDVRTTAHL